MYFLPLCPDSLSLCPDSSSDASAAGIILQILHGDQYIHDRQRLLPVLNLCTFKDVNCHLVLALHQQIEHPIKHGLCNFPPKEITQLSDLHLKTETKDIHHRKRRFSIKLFAPKNHTTKKCIIKVNIFLLRHIFSDLMTFTFLGYWAKT